MTTSKRCSISKTVVRLIDIWRMFMRFFFLRSHICGIYIKVGWYLTIASFKRINCVNVGFPLMSY